MTASLSDFRQALLAPDLRFATLGDAVPATDPDGMPLLCRTTLFAEAEIAWRGGRWLLFLPLSPSALPRIERTAVQLKRLNTDLLTEYRILPGELFHTDFAGGEQRTDLVLQRLPEGMCFEEALATFPRQTLLGALDELQRGLRQLGFSHNNLKGDNLVWSNGRLVPIRYHHARFGGGDDTAAFDALRLRIGNLPGAQTVGDLCVTYNPRRKLTGHRWTSHVFEGLVCVEDATGFGFVDTDNNTVIPARFLWAGDFHEGRAEVLTPSGMGLIDKTGCYVIGPEYEIVEYDAAQSIVRVRQNGRWALFDYLGHRLTEFGTKSEM